MSGNAIPAVVIAGITFYAGIYQLMVYLRRRDQRADLTFALTCFSVALYDVFSAGLYNAASTVEGARWQRAQLVTLTLACSAFFYFFADFMGLALKKVCIVITAFYAVFAVTGIVDRSNLTLLVDQPFTKHITLPWGTAVTYYEVALGPVFYLQNLFGILVMITVFGIGLRRYRRQKRRKIGWMLATAALFFAGSINDALISIGLYQFVYLIEYAYLGVMVLMSYSLSDEVLEAVRVKESLQKSEEKFRNIVEHSPLGMHIYHLEPDERLIFVGANPAADAIFGVDHNRFIGKTIEDAFPALINTQIPEHYHRCALGDVWHTEHIDYLDEQIKGAFEVHAFNTAPNMMVAAFQEITERKRAEYELQISKEAEHRFSTRLTILLEVVNELSQAETFDDLCRGAIELGCERLGFDRLGIWFLSDDHATMQGSFGIDENGYLRDERSVKRQAFDDVSVRQILGDEKPWVQLTSDIVYNEKAEPVGHASHILAQLWSDHVIIGFISADNLLTQRSMEEQDGRILGLYASTLGHLCTLKRMQEALRNLTDALEQRVADRTVELEAKAHELETFAYSVSHDLKAPLRGIDGYSRLLLDEYADNLDDEGRTFLITIRQATNQMNQLINDLLAYSRLERRAIFKGQVDLATLIQKLVVERSGEIDVRHIDLVVDVPLVHITAEAEGLAQALRNLLDNALKFTRDMPVPRIEIGGQEMNHAYRLWVKDNGIGFEMQYHNRIFEIFQRLHHAEDYPGTGIGLALVHKVMQRMDGKVWAESTPGAGATFYLELPRQDMS